VATTILVAAKVTKVKAAIKGIGGGWKVANLLVRASTRAERLAALKMSKDIAAEFLGITMIKAACF
jgi:hypothetical protein